jgi:hypothetical protein
MDRFTKQDLNDLIDQPEQPKLSLYLPTIRAGREVQQNSTRFKNLLRRAEDRLCDYGLRRPEAQEYLKPAWEQLLIDETFWQHQSDGLALFLTPDLLRYYRLPVGFDETIRVGGHFYVKPLFEWLNQDQRFYILAISQDELRLLEGTSHGIEAVDLEGVPSSLAEALRWDDPEKQSQYHTVGRGDESGDQGRPGITFHGHAVGRDDEKTNILRYFHKVDQGLKDFLETDQIPLVLAGVEYLYPIYREANSYNHLLEEGIPGNPEELENETLLARAWDLLEPIFERQLEEAVALYAEQSGMQTGKTLKDVEEIVPAAYAGQVDHLLIQKEAEIWGSYNLSFNQVEVHPERNSTSEDLTNTAAIYTFKNGGEVFIISEEEMPEDSAIAAILRYSP